MVAQRDIMTARIPGIGESGIEKIRAAKVLVVGAGGLGSPVLAYLAAAGIGTIGISDPDNLEESNLQRQVIHGVARLGMNKAESAKITVLALNPDIQVNIEPKIIDGQSDETVAAYDFVVDATDNFTAKYAISYTCARVGRPHMWGTLVSMSFQASLFTDGLTLRDIYPEPPTVETMSSKTVGVLGAVCGQGGSVLATECLKWVTGVGEPLIGRLLIVDTAAGRWNVVPFRPRTTPAKVPSVTPAEATPEPIE